MGDGGSFAGIVGNDPENRAQNMSSLLGKMLRIDPTRAGSTWKMVALGLRNPWRFSFDRKTGDMWIGDVGAGAQEEVDFRPKAQIGALANYGWSRYEGTSVYGLKKPLDEEGQAALPGVDVLARHRHALLDHRRVRLPRRGGAVRARPLLLRRLLPRRRLELQGRAEGARGVSPSALSGNLPNLSSFGEDGNGELYATTIDGGLYELR